MSNYNKANCFTDKGRKWTNAYLLRAATNLPIFMLPLDETFLESEIIWKANNVRDFIVHFNRIREADLEVPIILRSDSVIMDGHHRLVKAMMEGKTYIWAKQFIIDPEPNV